MMYTRRFPLVLCAMLVLVTAPAFAQRLSRSTLGNALAARQRSAGFLAERGLVLTHQRQKQLGGSPAQLLARARAEHGKQVRQEAASGVVVPSWQPVGPDDVFTSAYGDVAGRVTSIAVDPADATGNTVFVGTAMGGVWESTNAAGPAASVTFKPLTDDVYSAQSQAVAAPSLSIGAVSVQPVSPGATPVILAGTGLPNDTSASYFGDGILRSTDDGRTWTVISQSSDLSAGRHNNFEFTGNGFAGFAWGTVNGQPVVVAAVSEAQESLEVGAGTPQDSVMGIYYSTDLGATWYMATISDCVAGASCSLAGNGTVQSPETVFTPCLSGGSDQPCGNAVTSVVWNSVRKEFLAAVRYHGYYESTDGENWTRLASQPGAGLTLTQCPRNAGYSGSTNCPIYNGVLAVQPVTGDTFALTTGYNTQQTTNDQDEGLWQDQCGLVNGSTTCASATLSFAQINDATLDSNGTIPQADYDLYLAAVPATVSGQPDTLLFAGTADIYRCDLNAGCVWRNTTNALASECNASGVAPAQFAVDATFGASGLMYFGNSGGIWRTTNDVTQTAPQCTPGPSGDAGAFENLNAGFSGSIAEVEDVAPDPSNPDTMMVSLGPLGTAANTLAGGTEWQQVLNGEGDFAEIDPANPQNWYATSEFGIGVNRCTNGTGCDSALFGSPVIGSSDVGNDGYGQIIPAPWLLDPSDTSNLLVGTCRVWMGLATSGALTAVSGMLDGDNGPYCNGNAEIRSLAASGGSSEVVYAGMAGLLDGGSTEAGQVFKQTLVNGVPASTQWADVSLNTYNFNPDGYDISSLYIDPHSRNGGTVYATIGGFGVTHLYQSTTGGSTWQDVSSNLINAPANSVVVDPNDANTVYVATDAGVYYTQDVGACAQVNSNCWTPYGSDLPNVPVVRLRVVTSTAGPELIAATDGRGVWQIVLPSATDTTAAFTPTVLTFPNEAVGTASAPQQLLVTNTGAVPLAISNIQMTGAFTESDTCTGNPIAPGNACAIEVRFEPTVVGAASGQLMLYANLGGGGQVTVPLNGTGTEGAAVTLTPVSLCFAATLVGQTASTACGATAPPSQNGQNVQAGQSVVIANTGGAVAAITSVTLSGDYAFVANTCGKSLSAANTSGDSCTVSITFTPTAAGVRAGALTVVDSAGTQTTQISGMGLTPATDTLSATSLSFGSQTEDTTGAAKQITMTNTGDTAVEDIAVSTSTKDYIAANDCGTTLAAHASCAIQVSFDPSRVGSDPGTLTVSDVIQTGASASPRTQTVALIGTGIAPAGVASIAPQNVSFGYYAVGGTDPNPQTVTLTNNGAVILTRIQTAITGDFALQQAANNPCGSTLAAGRTCNFGVIFEPTAVNQRTGSLTVSASNLPVPLVIPISGSGADFALKVNGASTQVVTGGQTPSPFTLEIDSVNGSQGPVNLTCAVVPATAACVVSPKAVTLTGTSSQAATLTFALPSQQARNAGASSGGWTGMAVTLALFVPIGFLVRRRYRGWLALGICLLALFLIPTGCGVKSSGGSGSSSVSGSGGGTVTGQYTVTVTANVPGLTQSVPVQVTVQ